MFYVDERADERVLGSAEILMILIGCSCMSS